MQTFRLATHLNAALRDGNLKIGNLPEFEGEVEWVFLVPGPNGYKLREIPDDWVATMRFYGARRAWFGYGSEPDQRGEGVWVESDDRLCFYRLSSTKAEEDGHPRFTLRGYWQKSANPRVPRVLTATACLYEALPPMIRLAQERKSEFAEWLLEANSCLDGAVDLPSDTLSFFPTGLYPADHVRLFSAARRGEVFGTGGMGSWYDTSTRDDEFRRTTSQYAAALYPAFVAASHLDLP